MGDILIDGVRLYTVMVWAAVSIGVANWIRERLRGWLDRRWESVVLRAFMVGRVWGRSDGSDGTYVF